MMELPITVLPLPVGATRSSWRCPSAIAFSISSTAVCWNGWRDSGAVVLFIMHAPAAAPTLLERTIEPLGNRGERAGGFHRGDWFELLVGGAPAFGLEFKREAAAVVDGEHVRNAGLDAESLQDRRLDRLALTPVGRMEGEDTRRATSAQMREHRALYCGFRTLAAHRSQARVPGRR